MFSPLKYLHYIAFFIDLAFMEAPLAILDAIIVGIDLNIFTYILFPTIFLI
jgi:hypothetical protein